MNSTFSTKNVNIIPGFIGVQGGAGLVTANSQRMAIATDANLIKITDGTDIAAVEMAADFGTSITKATLGLTTNSRSHQQWPSPAYRPGIGGDNDFYPQLQNDLGDTLMSISSLTTASGASPVSVGEGEADSGTLRVVTASNSPENVIYTTRIDDAGSGVTYFGEAAAGSATSAAVWRIRKITDSGTPTDTSILFADGDTNFDGVWDNRAALTYS